MSDIPDSGSFNSNLASIASAQYGPGAVANQSLVQQQAQGAAIQNANARLQYQLFANAMGHMTDFSGQGGPSLGSAADDASGVTASSALPGAGSRVRVNPEMDIGASASDQALIESTLEQQYNVNPMGTPQEQQAIMAAHQYAAQMALSGNKGLAESANQRLEMLKDQRDMNVANRRNAAMLDASQHYDKLYAVANAPEGKAWDALERVAPDSAAKIRRQNPKATDEELDKIARDTTNHVGAFMHRFTDRPVKVGDDQATYDEKTGQRVGGVPIRGVSPEKQAELLKQATEVKTFKNSDGTETTEEQYKHDGYSNPNLWVSHAVEEMRARNSVSSVVEAARNRAARVPVNPQPGAPQPGAPQPGAPQPGAPQPGAPQPQQDNGMLPGVDPDKLPRPEAGPVKYGTSIKPGDLKTQEGAATVKLEKQKEASDGYSEAVKSEALIRAAQREADALSRNPRMVGPGSELAQGLAKVRAFVSGQPPEALVDLGALDKILLQMGAQNIRGALSGQRITNQEFMKMLTEGNPNSEQPLATIKKLLNYQAAQVDYDKRFNRTKGIALMRGAEPINIDANIGSVADRGDYIESRVGVRPPIKAAAGAATPPKITSQADYDKLNNGDAYVDANGKPHIKGGRK